MLAVPLLYLSGRLMETSVFPVFLENMFHQTFHSFFKLILFELQQACCMQPSHDVFNQKHECGGAHFYKLAYCLEPHPRWEFEKPLS